MAPVDRLSPELREQLLRVARQTARTNGAAFASAEAVRSHREVAVHTLTGDGISGNDPVWVLQIKGTRPFTCRVCSVPPGVKRPPGGRYIIDIVKARTLEMTDFNIQTRPSDLGALGSVTTFDRPHGAALAPLS